MSRGVLTILHEMFCLELVDIRRLTDWSVAPALSNNDLETLSLKETDIHDVTAVRMAAKLTENVRYDLTTTSENNLPLFQIKRQYSKF